MLIMTKLSDYIYFLAPVIFLVIFKQVPVVAQEDHSALRDELEEARKMTYTKPQRSIQVFEELQLKAEIEYYPEGVALAELGKARAYFTLGEPRKSFIHIKSASDVAAGLDSEELKTDISFFKVRLYLATKKAEQARIELDALEEQVINSSDTARIIDWYCLMSRSQDMKYDLAGAMLSSETAQKLSLAYDDPGMNAVVNYTIGGNFFRKGETDKARYYYRLAIAHYESLDNKPLLLTLYTNMMATFRPDQMYDSVLLYIQKKQAIQEALGSKIGMLTTSEDRAHILVDMGRFEEAREQTARSLELCREFNTDSSHSLYWMGIVHRGLNKYDVAADYMKRAFSVAEQMANYGKMAYYAQALYYTYFWKDRFEEAIGWYQTHIQFRDSVYSERQQQEIEIYTARFEAAEKEKEIIRLEKEREIDGLKKNRVIGISISGLIIGLLFIVLLVYRNNRNKQMFEKEKALAESKRVEAELKHDLLQKDLDMKKQELVSSMLQIAKKNEFLIDIKEQISEKLDSGPVTKRISNQLQREINAEEDWDKFIGFFRDVHPSFLKRLAEISSGLTKSETKLACLLRMNLSSKDIANMLNISSEGIKKARYRLRKKLSLDTEIELHEYLIKLT
jgi:tetratricopeptide (TPR) repeat protein